MADGQSAALLSRDAADPRPRTRAAAGCRASDPRSRAFGYLTQRRRMGARFMPVRDLLQAMIAAAIARPRRRRS